MAEDRTFELGVVMAGAISAGAYTAGVMDFLFEALDAYEEAKRKPAWNGPTHNVRIPVMAGASAGGMTSAISALHAFHDLDHVWPGKLAPPPARNRLYSSWVTDISLRALLETTDLEGGRDAAGVMSMLCCDVLDRIVGSAFDIDGPVRRRNWIGRGEERSLRVMLTLTNVRGVPYSFPVFGSDAAERFGMLSHADFYDFAVGMTQPSDGPMPLDIDKLDGPNWERFRTAALATGAFPVGLRPRVIEKPTAAWYKNAGCVGYEDASKECFVNIAPDGSFGAEAPYQFAAVDGGTIDNEPLELARRYLADQQQHNERDGEKANKAVVLVAPFPSLKTAPAFDGNLKLIHLMPVLASALIDQARFKPDELQLAANDKVFSRFMISPIREDNGSEMARKYPIACGVMGGFGGFIDESFRRHDYLLGRRNAQAFLRWNFGLPETNPLFQGVSIDKERWYVKNADNAKGSLGLAADTGLDTKKFATEVEGGASLPGFPIIPLVEELCAPIEIGPQDMPKPEAVSLDDIKTLIGGRAKAVITTLIDFDLRKESDSMGMVVGEASRLAARHFGTHVVTEKAYAVVEQAVKDVRAAFA
jgi:hypothetical protein